MNLLADISVNWWTYTQGALTLIVALVAASIAFLAWLTNQEKLRLDLYDRRLKLCQRLRKLANDGSFEMDGHNLNGNKLFAASLNFRFLFGRDVEAKVVEIAHAVCDLNLCRGLEGQDRKHNRVDGEYGDEITLRINKIRDMVGALVEYIGPYLDFHKVGMRRGLLKSLLKYSEELMKKSRQN